MFAKKLSYDVVVIGGGATGVGIARDAAMRGFSTVLVERADLAQGTTARYHGLLHSGGRYVVTDPKSARECAGENMILRRLHPDAVEETGGLFITLSGDDEAWPERFLAGAHATSVPVEEISPREALQREPRLNRQIMRAFTVQDATIDGWSMVWGAARSAEHYGARILPYTEVSDIYTGDGRVTGVRAVGSKSGDVYDIECRFVVNAAGPWAGHVARMAGCTDIEVVPGRGVMIAMNHRLVNHVVNRCVEPSDGDIIVPAHTVAIIGTTDTAADNPDRLGIPARDVQQMLSAGEELIPGFRASRALHVWSGARPLLKDTRVSADDTRHMSRDMAVRTHNVWGLITVAGGKLTTYRLMAEKAVDTLCELAGVRRECRTASEPVAQGEPASVTYRLEQVERAKKKAGDAPISDPVICECELVTRSQIEAVFDEDSRATFDDVRRKTRIGMGPCQGCFCASRVAGIACEKGVWDAREASELLKVFVKNRWGGLYPIMYGQGVREAALTERMYRGTYNIGGLGDTPVPSGAEYLPATEFPARGGMAEPRQDEPRQAEARQAEPPVHTPLSSVADSQHSEGVA